MPVDRESEMRERTVDPLLVDLICADGELLHAEFDAIIAAEWPDPPAPVNRGQPERHGSGREESRFRPSDSVGRLEQESPIGHGAWRRQRSPPECARSHD